GKALSPKDLKEAERDLGFPPRQVEQVIVVLDQAKPEPEAAPKKLTGGATGIQEDFFPKELIPHPGVIVRFNVAVDGKALVAQWLKEFKEGDLQGKKVYRRLGEAPMGFSVVAHVANDRTILFGTEPVLKKMLVAEARGPLVDRLKALEGPFDLAGVVLLAPYQDFLNTMAKALAPGLPPPWNEAAALAGKLD